jgi:hypothetical protein
MDVLAVTDKRQGDDGCAGAGRLAGAGSVVEHFAAELVAEDDRLVRAHEVGVTGLGHHVGELVAVVAGVQVRAADAAAQDVDEQLALRRRWGRLVDDLEFGVGASDGFHSAERRR